MKLWQLHCNLKVFFCCCFLIRWDCCPSLSAQWLKKFLSLPTGIPFVCLLRWTGTGFKPWWTVWCCCHVFSSWLSWTFTMGPAVHLEEPHCSTFFFFIPIHLLFKCASACVPLGEWCWNSDWQNTFETIWKVCIKCYWILVIVATLLLRLPAPSLDKNLAAAFFFRRLTCTFWTAHHLFFCLSSVWN